MAVMSEKQLYGCRRLLQLLSEDDLLALSDTVTNRLIRVTSSRDLQNECELANILVLMAKQKVGTVAEAIEAIITYSQSPEELLKRKKVHRDVIFKYLAGENAAPSPNSEKHQLVKRTIELWSSDSEKTVSISSAQCPEKNGDGLEVLTALGKQFCQWFFQLLNSQNPQAAQPVQQWGPQHFWSDAKMILVLYTQVHQKEEFLGAELVSQRLFALVSEERLVFCPNLEQTGLKCVSSPHGLVLVAVAGTIHRENTCLAVFEQVFGLIRDPLKANHWKIKHVHLKIMGEIRKETLPAVTYDSKELFELFTS